MNLEVPASTALMSGLGSVTRRRAGRGRASNSALRLSASTLLFLFALFLQGCAQTRAFTLDISVDLSRGSFPPSAHSDILPVDTTNSGSKSDGLRVPDTTDQKLETRAVQSEATCLDTFNWMDNSQKQPPCIVAGYLLAACAGGDWIVVKIPNNTVHYTAPDSGSANGCRCSWAVYNTLQACADCQGENFQSAMLSWSGYSAGCNASLLSTSNYYPADTPIATETAIPFWATTNPTTWPNGLFDPSMAESIANEGKPDITQSSRSSSSSGGGGGSNTGAIVGGVIGGLIALFALALLVFYLRRRRRLRSQGGRGDADVIRSWKWKQSRPMGVRFSPLAHWRTGSSGSAGQTLTGTFTGGGPGQGGGKVAGQTAHTYGNPNPNLTPSPGPTLPVSTMIMGSSSGLVSGSRPPYGTMPSSSSFTSGGSGTASPPLDYVTTATPGKPYGYTNAMFSPPQPGIGMGLGPGQMVMTNNASNPTFSSTYATAGTGTVTDTGAPPSSTAASGMARISHGHTHTLSNDSAVYSMNSSGEVPEGAITPFVLPPVLPEPMGPGLSSSSSDSPPGHRSPTPGPGLGGKGGSHGHGRGPSDSSVSTNTNHPQHQQQQQQQQQQTLTNRPSHGELYTTAHAPGNGTRRPPPERRNPPAYSPEPPEHSHPARATRQGQHAEDGGGEGEGEDDGDADGDGDGDGDADGASLEAHRSPTTLSGTTLLQTQSRSGRDSTVVSGEQENGHGNGNGEERRERRYPVDQKV